MQIVYLRVSNGARAAEKLPARLKIFNWGENATTKGKYLLDEKSAEIIPLNQREHGRTRIALDFEHNTVPGSPEYERTREPRDIAAKGALEIVPGDGLYLLSDYWTPAGESAAKNYEDLSLAFASDKQGRVIFVHSVGLTNSGAAFDGPTFLSATAAEQNPKPKTQSPNMSETNPELVALTASIKALTDRTVALEAKLSAAPAVPAELTALSAEVKALKEGIATQATASATAEKSKIVALFATQGKAPLGADGKPMSLEVLAAQPIDALTLLLANTPKTIALSAKGTQHASAEKKSELTGLARAQAAHTAELAAV